MTLYGELGRAVSRGFLPLQHAEAALLVGLARAERFAGGERPRSGDLSDRFQIARRILDQHIAGEEAARDRAWAAISRVTRPLIQQLVEQRIANGRGRVRAEAHDVNALHGLPFTEDEVEGLLQEQLRTVRGKRADAGFGGRRRGRRHGR